MAKLDSPWINVVAATIGGLGLGYGLGSMYGDFTLRGLFWAVLGFLVLGWAVLDRRRFRPGATREEEEGRTVE